MNPRSWVADAVAAGATPLECAAALARRLAAASHLPVDGTAPALLACHNPAVVVPAAAGSVEGIEALARLGEVHETAMAATRRHAHGVHYTPLDIARGLSARALDGAPVTARVCDPSAGGGVFLLAAAEHLERRGGDRSTIVGEQLWGIDLDADAVEVCRAALSLWASPEGGPWVVPDTTLRCADALDGDGDDAWDGTFDVVVGNPPFQGQLTADTARTAAAAGRLRDRWNCPAGPYADTAAWFLLAGLDLVVEGGVVLLVQPRSVLGTADAAPIRQAVGERSDLSGFWLGGEDVFGASVDVCAIRVRRRDHPQRPNVERWRGPELAPAPPAPWPGGGSWTGLATDLQGVPSVVVSSDRTVADRCRATAGFRRHFYGLAEHTIEEADAGPGRSAPLVTVGMIDPLRSRRGTTSFRFAGQRWSAPSVDVDALSADDPDLAAWVAARLGPKVLVATQTRVLEVLADPGGRFVPSTPVVAVACDRDEVWHVAAALCAPALTALALHRSAGTALSADTLKLSARQVLDLPLPVDDTAWSKGAALAQAAAEADDPDRWRDGLKALGREMDRAYGVAGQGLAEWWVERLPPWR